MDVKTDEQLMKSYQEGDVQAFKEIYERYEGRFFSFISARVGHGAVREDIFQLTWLKVHRSRQTYNSSMRFSTWAYSILINTIRDHYRQTQVTEVPLDGLNENLPELVEDSSNPEVSALLKQDMGRVADLLNQLSDQQREALLLKEVEGFSSDEAARAMGISSVAFRQILSRARKALRNHFERSEVK